MMLRSVEAIPSTERSQQGRAERRTLMRTLDTPAAFPALSRRSLVRRALGAAATLGLGAGVVATTAPPLAALDPDLRDAALRGLALAGYRGDPVTAAAARAALERLTETDPEGAILGRIYQRLDVRPAAYWPADMAADMPAAAEADLAALHRAIRVCAPVAFGYTDLSGVETTREVLPLALVHPPQGVKLLAWCETRDGFRQFFVRAITGLAVRPGDFGAQRMALLQGLLEKETGLG